MWESGVEGLGVACPCGFLGSFEIQYWEPELCATICIVMALMELRMFGLRPLCRHLLAVSLSGAGLSQFDIVVWWPGFQGLEFRKRCTEGVWGRVEFNHKNPLPGTCSVTLVTNLYGCSLDLHHLS